MKGKMHRKGDMKLKGMENNEKEEEGKRSEGREKREEKKHEGE